LCRSRFEDDYHERIAANNTSAAGGEWEKKTGDRRSEYRIQKSVFRRQKARNCRERQTANRER
jgi:hypothetical protein